jgi:hypothetical protein
MEVTFKLYANLQDYLPAEALRTNSLRLELPDDTTVLQVIERFSLPLKSCHLVLIDGVYLAPAERAQRVLKDREVLAIWPPIAGG